MSTGEITSATSIDLDLSSLGVNVAYDSAPPDSIDAIEQLILKGLPDEHERLRVALVNKNYYDLKGWKHLGYHETETEFDKASRPHRCVGFLRKVIRTMCRVYSPGPGRRVEDSDEADTAIAEIFEQEHANERLKEAERFAMLNKCSMIQVVATGEPDRPIRLQTLGAHEFAVWCSDKEPDEPWAVCTITVISRSVTRYQLFTADEVRTYLATTQQGGKANEAPRVQRDTTPGANGLNPYRTLPFVPVHHERPCGGFWDTVDVGDFLRRANWNIDRELSDLGNHVKLFMDAILYGWNIPVDWRPVIRPGVPVIIPRQFNTVNSPDPMLGFMQPQLAVEQVWQDARNVADQVLTDLELPLSTARGEATTVESGIALIVEQTPLLHYLTERQPYFTEVETELVRVVLLVLGYYYARPGLVAVANSLRYTALWPEPVIPIPLPERNESDAFELENRIMSPIQLVSRRLKLTREQAVEHLQQVALDLNEYNDIMAGVEPPAGQEPQPEEDDEGEPEEDEPDSEEEKTESGAGEVET